MSSSDPRKDSLEVLRAKESMIEDCISLIERAGWRGLAIGVVLGFVAGVLISVLLAGAVLLVKFI
jgi:ElaB/YqjD/DUF883 family membrane-anchored ribosome-binding protein